MELLLWKTVLYLRRSQRWRPRLHGTSIHQSPTALPHGAPLFRGLYPSLVKHRHVMLLPHVSKKDFQLPRFSDEEFHESHQSLDHESQITNTMSFEEKFDGSRQFCKLYCHVCMSER